MLLGITLLLWQLIFLCWKIEVLKKMQGAQILVLKKNHFLFLLILFFILL